MTFILGPKEHFFFLFTFDFDSEILPDFSVQVFGMTSISVCVVLVRWADLQGVALDRHSGKGEHLHEREREREREREGGGGAEKKKKEKGKTYGRCCTASAHTE